MEENREENLCNLGLGKHLLDTTLKICSVKELLLEVGALHNGEQLLFERHC